MKLLQTLKQEAKKLKAEIHILALAYRDKRTPVFAKLLIGLTVAYLLSPIDLIPDFIPVLGILDDLIIVPLLIKASLKLIPASVMEDARETLMKNPVRLKKNNWLFALVIIAAWVLGLFLSYNFIKRLFGHV